MNEEKSKDDKAKIITLENLKYLEGPWRNDACIGYAIMAMRRAGLEEKDIRMVICQMAQCFDDTSVEEAALHYMGY